MAKPKKPAATNPVTEPHWRTVERVVALLEKTLAPNARVRHNVKLPNIVTGDQEQFDVVIETGEPPRVITTVVEVQDRRQRVKPTEFKGWCEKMREVGAHRLICVSALPFPKSIKNKVAKQLGPVVLLIRLEDLEEKRWPFPILNNVMEFFVEKQEIDPAVQPNPKFYFAVNPHPFTGLSGIHLDTDSKVIRREGNPDLLPLSDLVNEGIKGLHKQTDANPLRVGKHRIPVRWKPKGVSLVIGAVTAVVDLVDVAYVVDVQAIEFPFEFLSYAQEGHGSTLAWVARAKGKFEGDDVEVRFVLTPAVNGGFVMHQPHCFGFKPPHVMQFRWGYAD